MKTFKIQILAILALLVLFSCKKELANSFANEQENIKNTNDGVKNAIMLKKDIIALNDVDEFHELYSFILKNQDDEMFLFTYIKDKYGITSMREIYEYGMKTEDHNTFNEYVTRYPKVFVSEYFDNSYIYNFPGSNILSYMVNSEGLIVVGDSIYEVDIKGTYINAVEKIILENGDKSFVKTEQGRFLPYDGKSGDIANKHQFSYRTVYWTDSRRLVARLSYKHLQNDIREYNAESTSQKRVLGSWWQADISNVGFYHNGGYIQLQNIVPIQYLSAQSWSKTNASNIKRTVYMAILYYVIHSQSSLILTHEGNRDGTWLYIRDNELFPY